MAARLIRSISWGLLTARKPSTTAETAAHRIPCPAAVRRALAWATVNLFGSNPTRLVLPFFSKAPMLNGSGPGHVSTWDTLRASWAAWAVKQPSVNRVVRYGSTSSAPESPVNPQRYNTFGRCVTSNASAHSASRRRRTALIRSRWTWSMGGSRDYKTSGEVATKRKEETRVYSHSPSV